VALGNGRGRVEVTTRPPSGLAFVRGLVIRAELAGGPCSGGRYFKRIDGETEMAGTVRRHADVSFFSRPVHCTWAAKTAQKWKKNFNVRRGTRASVLGLLLVTGAGRRCFALFAVVCLLPRVGATERTRVQKPGHAYGGWLVFAVGGAALSKRPRTGIRSG